MTYEVIKIHGKDVLVRQDTARSYRFVTWGLITLAICLATLTLLFIVLLGDRLLADH